MNTNQMDYFLKAYSERSYTAAARLVPMSAQGLAKAIHALEGELGVPLFVAAEAGHITPTAYAEEFRAFCNEVDDARRRLDQSFQGIDEHASETLRLAAAIGSLGVLGIDLLSEFKKSNPHVDVACDDLPDIKVEESLLNETDSIAITVLPCPGEFQTVPLASCERYVWVGVNDPLAAKATIKTSDLHQRRVALVGPLFKNYNLLLDAFKREGIEPADITTSSEMIWLHHFAKEGGGVAFTAQTVIELFEDDPSVVARPFVGMPYEIGVSWLKTHVLTEAEKAFVELCRQRARELEVAAVATSAPSGKKRGGLMGGLVSALARSVRREP